ncbi:MAG: DUF1554 domain-containing protein [Myxococcales bacterium]|nr:DUF1554 domain-containing protein [Myxococcales bacterium]
MTPLRPHFSCIVPTIVLLSGCFPGLPVAEGTAGTTTATTADPATAAADPTTTGGANAETTGGANAETTGGPNAETTGDANAETTGGSPAETADDSTSEAPMRSFCGDGVLDGGEECDDGNKAANDGCGPGCALEECGDGVIQTGEGCDDGNGANTDECLNSCEPAACGDGHVQTGVEQCDDGNDIDTDSCVGCKDAACGDSHVQAGVEDCDDANDINTDSCVDCKDAFCGDGYKGPGEECDDGNNMDPNDYCNTCKLRCGNKVTDSGEECDDGNGDQKFCDASCKRASLIVFVTEQKYKGNLGGLSGADAKCIAAANDAGLNAPEKYVAWLSDTNADAKNRAQPGLMWEELSYVTVKGDVVAEDYTSFKNKTHQAPINVYPDGGAVPNGGASCAVGVDQKVWTGTDGSFFINSGHHCANWSSNSSSYDGDLGRADYSTWQWNGQCRESCDTMARLYCVETPK